MANGTDDLQDEEDEAVRCICGSEDYPGRPPVEGPDADFFAGIELTEEVTGFFVQCDICKVWQHGACVGIFSAEASPDEYFCEQCRKDLHRIHTASNGLTNDLARDVDSKGWCPLPETGRLEEERLSSASQAAAKRRSTMNSRDAAYDDELLRRVIEASKEDAPPDTSDTASRPAKRGRSDSEENGTIAKRQRTGSRSVSPPVEQPDTNGGDASDEDSSARNGAKKSRNNRSQREKSEKEDKEQQRQEAANKRKGRAERRRAEDSDLSEEMPLTAAKVVQSKSVEPPSVEETPTPAQPPGTPPTSNPTGTAGTTHKRAARSSHKRGKGRNQYTKDREADDESPARSMSRDIQKNADEPSHGKAPGDGKHGHKGKQAAAHKMSMLDMKRRVAAIMEFISRTQVDLAGEHGGSTTTTSGADTPQKDEAAGANGDATAAKAGGEGRNGATPDASDAKGFKELSCMEMMDVLTRDMVKWQNQYS
ncbi:hypothetical protein ACCO45_010383 [Purpureocillium lilacinum]|uniref:Uncharacterized protein n=1 Tax=Purpureocillium lilacinum TaxID=33203 RepID=A0ACC4DEQ3_PURLI